MPSIELGESIPANTAHAVSVSLPTWKSNVGYEEGEKWVTSTMVTGYPRFFIHRSIAAFAEDICARYAQPGQQAMLFPNSRVAKRCLEFIRSRASPDIQSQLFVLDLALEESKEVPSSLRALAPTTSAVIYPEDAFPLAKQYWQHTGDGSSSRRAEFCHGLFKSGLLVPSSIPPTAKEAAAPPRPFRGPKRYQRSGSIDAVTGPITPKAVAPAPAVDELQETSRFLEERFGRNLGLSLVERAKSAIRRRIAGTLSVAVDLSDGPLPVNADNSRLTRAGEEDDVYLYPCGMNAIYNAHRVLLRARGDLKSVNFGFPYVDTLKILQKFGPGCLFLGHASAEDLDSLEDKLRGGERYLALFCEFPGNPLLTCPDLDRIRKLADEFDFAVVVDETIGTFANVHVLQVADVVVSSLTKIFSGETNVMGGSLVLNPNSRYYGSLKEALRKDYDDTYWAEDVIFMERNSRDFLSRIDRVNSNAEAIADILNNHRLVKIVYYPKYNSSRPHYEARRLPQGGYGGLLSVVFHRKPHAEAFYDAVETAKGPSLGTNFTLCSPYVILAHYNELEWAEKLGVDPNLIRISIGLEDSEDLQEAFRAGLAAAEAVQVPTIDR